MRILLFFFLLISSQFIHAQDADQGDVLAQPIFKDGEAQIVAVFKDADDWIKEEVWVETNFDSDHDGRLDRMHVFITRPKQTNTQKIKLPIIYQSSPYYGLRLIDMMKETPKKYFWNVNVELNKQPKPHQYNSLKRREKRPMQANSFDKKWVPRGFITAYSSSPGTGLSDGAPTIGGTNERLAPAAVINWFCNKAKAYLTRRGQQEVKAFWSNGKVGMTGTSYDGTLALAAATTGVEGLKAIIPVAPVSSFYHYYRANGLVKSPGGYVGEDVDVLYDFVHTADNDKRAKNNKLIRDEILRKKLDRKNGDYNDFWASRDLLQDFDKANAAMLIAHGFNDWNVMPYQSYRIFEAAKKKNIPVQLYYHQKGHGGDPPLSMMNKWFTRYLHDVQNNVEQDDKVWIVQTDEYLPTAYSDYPDPLATYVNLYPKPVYDAYGTLGLKSLPKRTIQKIIDNSKLNNTELAEAANSKNRLLYVSQPLKKDVRISGICKATIRLACNRDAANLSVYLVSLPLERSDKSIGTNDIITRGWMDPQNRNSLRKSEPLEKNKFYTISFDLQPDDQVIKIGEQIGFMIFSSDKDFTLRPKPGTKLQIDLSQTKMSIPVVGGSKTLEDAF